MKTENFVTAGICILIVLLCLVDVILESEILELKTRIETLEKAGR